MVEIICNGSPEYQCECVDCQIKKAKLDSTFLDRPKPHYSIEASGDHYNRSYWDEMSGNF